MSEKFPPLSELTKLAADQGLELPDEVIDAVAGGVYSQEEWASMSTEERMAAQKRSVIYKFVLHQPCELDPGVDPHNMP